MGVDRSGSDLPNMPFKLDSADPNLCWASCNKTEGCLAWAYVHPNAWGGNGEGGGRGLQSYKV